MDNVVNNSNNAKKIKSKRKKYFTICAMFLALSIILGVIFIPDWNSDVSINNDLTIKEQIDDDYISTDDEIQSSNVNKDNSSSEEATTLDNKVNNIETEELTTEETTTKETTTKNNSTSDNIRLSMPNIVGKDEETAKSILMQKGLKVTISYANSDSVASGKVISQSPKANSSVYKGNTVTIVVSSGKRIIAVPNVVGMTSAEAKAKLTSLGFNVSVAEEYSSTVASGNVVSQSPNSSVSLEKGATVNIVVSKGKQPVKVIFDANGGSVGTGHKTVYYTSTYGSLPTPTRDYYDFNGWYTSASGGSEITSSSKVNNSENHTLYAHWTKHPVSGWVLASNVPAGAQIVDEKWTYTKTETTESTSSSLSGWTQTGSYWKQTGSGTHYYASFPSGFNTSDSRYSKYHGSALSSKESTNSKRKASGSSVHTYIYYHWCYALSGYHTETNREVGAYNGEYINGCGYTTIWECFESTTNATNYADNCYKFTGHSTYSYWWYKVPVYKQTYTNYQKVYQYKKVTTGLESSTQVIAGGQISNVQKYVKYRAK